MRLLSKHLRSRLDLSTLSLCHCRNEKTENSQVCSKAMQVCREHRDRLFLTLFFQLIKCHFDKDLLLRKDCLNEAKQAFSSAHPPTWFPVVEPWTNLIFSVLLFWLYNAGSSFSPSCPALYVVFVRNNPYQGSCLLCLWMFAFRIGAKPDPDLGLCLWVPPRNPCWNLFTWFPSADVFPPSL